MCVYERECPVLRTTRGEGGGHLAPLQPSDELNRAGKGDVGKGNAVDGAREGEELVPSSQTQKNRPRFLLDQSLLEAESGSKTDGSDPDKCKTQ